MAVVLLPGSVEEEEALTVINAARQDLLVGQHVGKQWDATKTLGSCENLAPQAAGVLSEAIARIDLDPGIRWGAAEAVAGLGQEAGNAAALELAKALLQRKPGQVASDAFVRTGLAESLGRLGRCARGSGAVALARGLQDDRDVRVRRRCAMALGQLGGVVAGTHGAAAIARGLKVDKDLPVRCRCAEALGAFGPIAGEDSTKALIQALSEDAEVDVRWRAALSLGQLGATAGKEGAAALLQARAKEKSVPVRDHCAGAAERLMASCLKTMDDNVHPYARGRAAWVLGALGDFAQPEGIEALAAFLLRPGEDVYLRRRAVEALAEQCPKAGPLAALAIKRAMEDPDVYVQWHAFETFNALPKPLQERAEDVGLAEQLHSLILKDVEKQRQLKKSRARQPLIRWEPGTAELEEFAAEKAQQAAEAAEAEAMARAEAEAVRAMKAAEEEAKLMEAMGKAAAALQERARQLLPGVVQRTAAGAGGDDGQGEPEEQLQKTFMDMSRSREVFKHFADGGELNRDALKEALQMLGHDTVNEEWVDAIIKDKFSDRSFLDQYDFSKFLAEYEACHMDYVRMRFTEADVDSSGKVDAEELAQVLRKAGMTPVTGVVPQLIAEVCGPRVTEVNFMNFAKILGILRYRLGFTQEEYSDIATSFKRLDRQGRGALNLAEARGCLEWLGFDLSVEEVEFYSTRVLKAHRGRTPKEDPEDMLLSEFDFVRLVRLVREEDARRVLTCLLKMRGEQEEDSMPARELPTLLSDMNVALASPDVVFEALKALGLEEKLELTLEDIMPVLWQLRRCQGLTQAELELARQQFEQCDEDGSGGMACAELEFAVRSLGFPVDYEEVQEKLDEWDMDESGEIEFIEFLKVLSDYKKKELQQVLTAMFTGQPKRRPSFAMHAMGEQSQPLPAAPKPKASMLQRQQTELPSLLLQSGHSPLRQGSGVLQFCLDSPAAADKKLNLWGFAGLIAEYRSEINAEIRRNQGFTEAEVIQLYETFRSYDPRGSGIIAKSQLRRLLLEHCPHAERTQAGRDQIATMIRESDQDGSGSIDFMEFLKLMRLVRNRWSREKLAKERAAVADTKFSVRELKEFRKVFKAWDANESLDLNFEELQKMIASITRVAQGAKGEKELHDIFRLFDSNNDDALDFPEFLRVMRKLLAENWRGINDSARRLSRTEIPAFDGALLADIDPGS